MFYETRNTGDSEHLRVDTENNMNFPRHIHNSYEIILMLGGEMNVTVDMDDYTLRDGDALMIFPNQIHSLSSEQSEHITFAFSPLLVSAYSTKLSDKIPADGKFRMPEHLKDALCALGSDSTVVEKKGALYSVCAFFDKTAEYKPRSSGSEPFFRIFTFVENNYTSECSLYDAVREVGMNYAYVSRMFKRLVGVSYNEYVNMLRLDRACYLMENTTKSITECALESGFSSTHTFNRNFKEHYGITPYKYRVRESKRE